MKFKPEDIGLYIAVSITGAGLGLLIGAIVSSILTKDDVVDVIDEEAKESPLPDYTEEEALMLIEMSPTEQQWDMLKNGTITVAELYEYHKEWVARVEMYQEKQEAKGKTDYHKTYKPEKETLGTHEPLLLEEKSVKNEEENDRSEEENDRLGLINDGEVPIMVDERYVICSNLSFFKDIRQQSVKKRIIFDRSDGSWGLISRRGHVIAITDLNRYVPPEAWEYISDILMSTRDTVYVRDVELDEMMEFTIEGVDDEPPRKYDS